MWEKYNCNPELKNVGDCVIRAISTAMHQSWDKTFIGVCLQGFSMRDMPSSNSVWGAYLRSQGWTRHILSMDMPIGYSVADFVRDNDRGTYILALDGHVVAAINGKYYDTWDSGDKPVLYYWSEDDVRK